MKKKKQKSIKKQQTQRIQNFLNEIDWLFQTNNFDKEIILKRQDEDKKAAEIIYDDVYQTITINIFPCFFNCSLTCQRKMLLHELCHSITLPSKLALYNFLEGKLVTPQEIQNINEKETSKIENILNGLLIGQLKYAVKAYDNYLKKI